MSIYHFQLSIRGMRSLHQMLQAALVTDLQKLRTYNVGSVACNEVLRVIVGRMALKIDNAEKREVKMKLRYVELRVLVEVLKIYPSNNEYETMIIREVLFTLHKNATIN